MLASLLELVEFCAATRVIPELLVVGQDLEQGGGERREGLPLIMVESMDLLTDQGVDCQQQRQPLVLMPPLFELREILQGPAGSGDSQMLRYSRATKKA